jgi:hypothetical protein
VDLLCHIHRVMSSAQKMQLRMSEGTRQFARPRHKWIVLEQILQNMPLSRFSLFLIGSSEHSKCMKRSEFVTSQSFLVRTLAVCCWLRLCPRCAAIVKLFNFMDVMVHPVYCTRYGSNLLVFWADGFEEHKDRLAVRFW